MNCLNETNMSDAMSDALDTIAKIAAKTGNDPQKVTKHLQALIAVSTMVYRGLADNQEVFDFLNAAVKDPTKIEIIHKDNRQIH